MRSVVFSALLGLSGCLAIDDFDDLLPPGGDGGGGNDSGGAPQGGSPPTTGGMGGGGAEQGGDGTGGSGGAACGDGTVDPSEECDSEPGCTPDCRAGVVMVSAGGYSSCAVLYGGVLKCWGDNRFGQLGLGDKDDRGDMMGEMGDLLPQVELGGRVLSVSVGDDNMCALLEGGIVKCWGENAYGQLGIGSTTDRGGLPGEMGDVLPAVDLGTGQTAKAISVGAGHACAILLDDSLKCWGKNESGQLGQGHPNHIGQAPGEMGDALPPVAVGAVLQVSAGSQHTCVLLQGGAIKCWGSGGSGRLGLGSTADIGDGAGEIAALAPVQLGADAVVQKVSAGDLHTCALLAGGAVKCWGSGDNGRLGSGAQASLGDGPGEMGDALPFVDLGPGEVATDIATPSRNTCAVLESGHVKCWGNGGLGTNGNGSSTGIGDAAGEMGAALQRLDLGAGVLAESVSGMGDLNAGSFYYGGSHVCALLTDAKVKCWGYNATGQLGLGHEANIGDGSGEMGDALPFVKLFDQQH